MKSQPAARTLLLAAHIECTFVTYMYLLPDEYTTDNVHVHVCTRKEPFAFSQHTMQHYLFETGCLLACGVAQ